MCYGTCHFEDYLGGCMVRNFDNFIECIGEPACYVGGCPDDEESDRYINEHKEEFRKLRKLAYEKNLIR